MRLTPKIHPATRPVEPEDPLSLHAVATAGDPDAMIRAIIEEFAMLGWDVAHILGLFRDPNHPMLHGLWIALGEEEIRARINGVVCCRDIFQLRTTMIEAPVEAEFGPDLVQIGPSGAGGGRHVHGL